MDTHVKPQKIPQIF